MENLANFHYSKAAEKLKLANEELCRPQEDVVTPMICQNARLAIDHYLRGFLVQNEISPGTDETIDSLFNQCKTIYPKFEKIEISKLDVYPHEGVTKNCGGTQKISQCYDIADSLDTFLKQEKITA